VNADRLRAFRYTKPEPPLSDAFEHPIAYLTLYLLSQFCVFALIA
jgi:hypothetical protein